MKPPKCKTCGAEEWRHICGPKADLREIVKPSEPLIIVTPEVNIVTRPKSKRGRPKAHGSAAEKQAAYRARKKKSK